MSNPNHEELSERAKYGSLYYTIPSAVYDDPRLSGEEKLFYILVSNLANKFGYCYASDEWFANKRQVEPRTIRRWLERLEELKYIRRETKKIGMGWDRKIFILPVDPQQDSNNVYERTFESSSRGHANGQICPDRYDKNVRRRQEDLNIITTTTTLPPSSKEPESQKERWWLKMKKKFGEGLSQEKFDMAWEEFVQIPPNTIKSPEGMLSSVVDKYMIYKDKVSEDQADRRMERIERHRQEALRFASGSIRIEETCIWVGEGSKRVPVGFAEPDEVWKEATRNYFK